jgi:hypothetical protein
MSTGVIYTGEVQNGKPNGYGALTDNEVTIYEGSWVNGVYHGLGILVQKDKKYQGCFQNGKLKNSLAKVFYSNGSFYEG